LVVTRLSDDQLDDEGRARAGLAATAAKVALTGQHDAVERALVTTADTLTDDTTADRAALERALGDARRSAQLDVLLVTGAGGAVLASSRTDPVRASGVAAPPDARLAGAGDDGDGHAVVARAPLRRLDGSVAGTLVGGRWIDDELLTELARPLGVVLAAVDGRGRRVASGGPAESEAGAGPGPAPSLTDTYRAEETLDGDGRAGADGLRLVAAVPRTATADLEGDVARALLVTALVGIVVLAVAALVAVRPLTRSVRRLTAAARAAAAGEDVVRLPASAAPETRELSRALAAVVARLSAHHDEAQHGRRELRLALDRMSEAFTLTHGLPAIMGVLVESAARVAGARAALFFALNAARGRLDLRSAHGPDLPGESLAVGEGLVGWVAEHGETAVWPGGVAPAAGEPAGNGPAVALPMRSNGQVIGVLGVYAGVERPPFTAEELDTLQLLVRQAGAAVDNALLHEEVKRQSITDGLTGVWNRRQFEMRSAEEVRSAARFHDPFGVVMVDVDHFKAINDRYGHQVGDAVLVEVARRLSAAVREIDMVARYGGEEFSLLLPRADLDETAKVADRVWRAVRDEPFRVDQLVLPVTVSAGVACHPDHGATVRELVAAADAALYRAKEQGRNRVEPAPGPVPEAVPEGSGG
jgi:diguanylate cyclase (GGDEF)-like protein